jgi:hypothetical protein
MEEEIRLAEGAVEMKHELSNHIRLEMDQRRIPLALVESALATPDQIVPEHGDVLCYQSKVEIDLKLYFIRVMVNETKIPPKVVTEY